MRLTAILIERQLGESTQILKESCDGLTAEQRQVVEGYYNEMRPLIEASLKADQISTIFGVVEKSLTAAGGNRTMLGQGKDAIKQANEIINKAGKWLQDTTPVKMFDQKFEDLKGKVAEKFPELADKAAGLGEWVKANPGKSAAVIGILTTLAGLAAGPVGGAIAGQVLRGAAELLKGEKLSTAIGKGVKTAALGYLSGKAFEMLGNWMAGFREQSIPFGPENAGLEQVSWGASNTIKSPGMEWTRTTQGFNALVRPEEAEAIRNAMAGVKAGDSSAFDSLLTIAKEVNSKDYKAGLDGMVQGAWQAAKANDSILQFINAAKQGLQAGAQGAVAAAGVAADGKKESVYRPQRPLSEGQVYLVFNRIETQQLNEGPMDAIKGAVGKAANWAATKGTNLTTKITADKLNAAWKKAGSPMDSDAVANILKQAGVGDDIIGKVYTDMKLPAPSAAPAAQDNAALEKMITQLTADEKQQLAKYITQQLGTA
jgi:hypothetical protein